MKKSSRLEFKFKYLFNNVFLSFALVNNINNDVIQYVTVLVLTSVMLYWSDCIATNSAF